LAKWDLRGYEGYVYRIDAYRERRCQVATGLFGTQMVPEYRWFSVPEDHGIFVILTGGRARIVTVGPELVAQRNLLIVRPDLVGPAAWDVMRDTVAFHINSRGDHRTVLLAMPLKDSSRA